MFIEAGDDVDNLVDKELFFKIKKWSFYKKKCLRDKQIIPESCFAFLNKVRKIRNNVHEDPVVYKFTERDLELFYHSRLLSSSLFALTMSGREKYEKDMITSTLGRSADNLLTKYFSDKST